MKKRRQNKYNAVRSESDGYSFASQGERDCYQLLKLLQREGAIEILKCQDTVYLTDARVPYRADFKILDKQLNEEVWIEYKGFETPSWRIKLKLWRQYGPGKLRIYKGRGLRVFLAETVLPQNQMKLEMPK